MKMDPKVEMIYNELEEIKYQMNENVQEITSHVVNLEELEIKSQQLQESSNLFKKSTSKNYSKCRDYIIGVIILLLILILLGCWILIFIIPYIETTKQQLE